MVYSVNMLFRDEEYDTLETFGARMGQKSDFRSLFAYTFFDLLTQNHLRKCKNC
jgi:hypothetical protein